MTPPIGMLHISLFNNHNKFWSLLTKQKKWNHIRIHCNFNIYLSGFIDPSGFDYKCTKFTNICPVDTKEIPFRHKTPDSQKVKTVAEIKESSISQQYVSFLY